MSLHTLAGSEDSWLQKYLVASVERNLCTQIHCTTCGAREFRHGLLLALAEATVSRPISRLDQTSALNIAEALATAQPAQDKQWQFEQAVRLILYDAWYAIGPLTAEEQLRPILGETWAGEVLSRMIEHHRARMDDLRRQAEENDPERVQQRREEKRRLKQEKHLERLALQKERARLWHEKHGTGAD